MLKWWKPLLVGVISVYCIAAIGQESKDAGAQTAPPTGPDRQSEQLTVKDPAEYNAYMTALRTTNLLDKVQALEEFLLQYPNSVVKGEVLKQELLVYQQVKNEDEIVRTAERLLKIEPANLRMLALLAYTYRECAASNGSMAKTCAERAHTFGQRGLTVLNEGQDPPSGMTRDEYDNVSMQLRPIFESAVRVGRPRGTGHQH